MSPAQPIDIVIIGASGHGREVLEIIETSSHDGAPHRPIGFVDDDAKKHGKRVHGLPVFGGLEWFENQPKSTVRVICAVGEPRTLNRLAMRASSLDLSFSNAVSPHAWVSSTANVGNGVIIFPSAVANTGVSIGDHVTVNVGATISHDSQVGAFSNVNPGVHLAGNVSVGEGCYIGMGANIIQNVSVGPWSIIGAGAVVIDDVPPGTTAVGNPARVIKRNLKAG